MGLLINQRRANVNGFYSTTEIGTALDIIRHYGVDYIIVGTLENVYYPLEGLAKFERMTEMGLLEKVYERGQSRVYRVINDAHLAQAMG